MMERVEIVFRYTKDEFVRACRQILCMRIPMMGRSTQIWILLSGIAMLYLLLFSPFSWLSVLLLIVFASLAVFCWMLLFYSPKQVFERNKNLQEESKIAFLEEGVLLEARNSRLEIKWSAYNELYESNEFYFLIQSAQNFTILPKRVFTEQSMQAFERIISEAAPSLRRSARSAR